MKFLKKSIWPYLVFLMILLSGTATCQDKFELTVAQDGSGDFTTIQSAIDACKAFPDQRVTVRIKNGIYREKVHIPSCNTRLSMIGEDVDKTVIIWDDHFSKINRGRNSTFYTWTLLVEADDLYMENITVENSAGPIGQAVALHVEGDRCAFRNCRFLGNQDTLYTAGHDSRQYFSCCYIEGTTDFIFGAATVLFEDCTIHSKSDSYITAASTPEGKPFGYVFKNCKLTAREGVSKVFLGRPWRDHARTVFLNCEMGAHILPQGWSNWGGTARDKTAYYAEFSNFGPGSATTGRVPWSHQLTRREFRKYNSENILKSISAEIPNNTDWITGKK